MADITYCASDCQDFTCKRHKSFAPLRSQHWYSMSDFSDDCNNYIAPKGKRK